MGSIQVLVLSSRYFKKKHTHTFLDFLSLTPETSVFYLQALCLSFPIMWYLCSFLFFLDLIFYLNIEFSLFWVNEDKETLEFL